MLIYNATYQIDFADARNFVIWIHQVYIQKVLELGLLKKPRLCKVLSHHDTDSECFSLQFEVPDSAILHKWYSQQGASLHEEMIKVFKDKVVGFTTLLEVIEES